MIGALGMRRHSLLNAATIRPSQATISCDHRCAAWTDPRDILGQALDQIGH